MKRCIISIVCLVFLICGCSRQPTVKPKTNNFTCRISVDYKEMKAEGELTVDQNGSCSLNFLSPDVLEGFTLTVADGKLSMEYQGIKSDLTVSDMTESAFIYEIFNCLSSIPAETLVPISEDTAVYEGHSGNIAFTLTVNSAGLPVKLEIPSHKLSVEFFEY